MAARSRSPYDETGALKPGVSLKEQRQWDERQAKRAKRRARKKCAHDKAMHAMDRYNEQKTEAAEAAFELSEKYAAIRKGPDDLAHVMAQVVSDSDGPVETFLKKHRLGQVLRRLLPTPSTLSPAQNMARRLSRDEKLLCGSSTRRGWRSWEWRRWRTWPTLRKPTWWTVG